MMFNFSDDDLLIEENEAKPNKYAARALVVGIVALVVCLILNEVRIFQITDMVMFRVTCGIGIFVCAVPQFLAYNNKIAHTHWCKYVVLLCVFALTFIVDLSLFIFATPITLLPLLLAAQYNSRRFSIFSLVGTCLIIVITVPLGCVVGFWQSDFLAFLLNYSIGKTVLGKTADALEAWKVVAANVGAQDAGVWTIIGHLSLYITFPWILCTLLAGRLVHSMARKGEASTEAQLQIRRMSKIDALTGLYNQNVYYNFVSSDLGEGKVGVLFFDVDGLKKVNDTYGHQFGDILLQNCAKSLKPLFNEKCCGFRAGGDEFVVIVDTDNKDELPRLVEIWEGEIKNLNLNGGALTEKISYRMSVGYSFGERKDIEALVSEADKLMYEKKRGAARS